MKKLMMCFALVLVTMLSTVAMFGCSSSDVELPEEIGDYYLVTVEGGTGGGNYLVGSTVKITATVADGDQFAYWTVDGEKVSSYNEYIFKLEGDITFKANFIDAVDPDAYEDVVVTTPDEADTTDTTDDGGVE